MRLPFKPLALLALAVCSTSCATAFVRSDPPDTVYPATQLDAGLILQSGIQGNPVLPSPRGERNSLPGRIVMTLGGLVDLPFSLVTDTLLFPFDLYRTTSSPEPMEESEPQE